MLLLLSSLTAVTTSVGESWSLDSQGEALNCGSRVNLGKEKGGSTGEEVIDDVQKDVEAACSCTDVSPIGEALFDDCPERYGDKGVVHR